MSIPGILCCWGALLTALGIAPAAVLASADPARSVAIVDLQPPRPISGAVLGANNLYWVDNDATWADRRFHDSIAALGLGSLRFPGGGVADNYDWETNRLVRPGDFPYEAKTTAEREGRLDYLEFLAAAHKSGINEFFFVANLESAFFAPGPRDAAIERYADKAARWVAAVKRSGYKVRHWEVGNESYLANQYPLTAVEYAKALRVFYRAMKAADPSIRIGAIGPHTIDGMDGKGFADTLGAGLENFRAQRASGVNPCEGERGRVCARKLGRDQRGNSAAPLWWDVVTREAGDSFDFAVIHRYRMVRDRDAKTGQSLGQHINSLKTYLAKRTGRDIPLAVTEWNTPGKSEKRLDEGAHAREIVQLLGEFLEGGVDFTFYWPLRLKGRKFSLLQMQNKELTASGQAMALARRHIGDYLARVSGNTGDQYVLATRRGRGYALVLVNRGASRECLHLSFNGIVGKATMTGEVLENISSTTRPRRAGAKELEPDSGTICTPGESILGVTIN